MGVTVVTTRSLSVTVLRAAGKDHTRTAMWCTERADGQTSRPVTDCEFEGPEGVGHQPERDPPP